MSLLTLHNLTKSYGGFEVFQDLSGAIGVNERVALVGMNGAGKSTLLHIIAGTELPDSGEVTLARGRRVGYLTQEVTFDPDSTLWEVMRAVFKDLERIAAEMRELEEQMSHAPAEEHDAIFERYAELSHTFEARGGYEYENKIQRVLAGLGFTKADYELKAGMLSGGQRTRAALAQLILSEPDLLLLDEPTNHLDLNATEWLEEELLRWQGSLLVASHDRYFLDRIAQRVWELDWGRLEEYNGNYSHYVEQRAERHAHRLQEYEDQQADIAKTEEFVRRYGAGQRAREAKGREKRMMRIERLERPREHQRLKLRLGSTLRSGDIVLDSMGMLVGYPGKPLLRMPKFEIRRGDRVALIGPNGAGKTTLLRTIMGENKPLEGHFRTGAAVRTGYYAQGHEGLNPEQTVLDEILDGEKEANLGQARSFLARFLFMGEDVYKRVGDLSGGERSRVALAKLAQHRSNFLILDEPTNHLDIPAQEELEDVLSNFDGTILFVSHDRYFIDELATQVWAVEPGIAGQPASLNIVRGGYAEYIEQRRGASSATQQKAVVPAAPQRSAQSNAVAQMDEKEARRRQRRVAAIETEITKLETRLTELTRLLDEASITHNVAEVERLGREYQELEEQIAARFEEWSSLAEAIA